MASDRFLTGKRMEMLTFGTASYEYNSESYQCKIEDLMTHDVDELTQNANALIDNLAADETMNHFTKGGETLSLHDILREMVCHAEPCGGDTAKRYALAAICACISEASDDVEDKLNSRATLYMLRELGKAWFCHILFPFYRHYLRWQDDSFFPTARPSKVTINSLNRDAMPFKEALFLRDGYRCTVTGCADMTHPKAKGDLDLDVCHILRTAVTDFDHENYEDFRESTMATSHILRHYACMSGSPLEVLRKIVDDPSNGLLLEGNAHLLFQTFRWCLEETEVQNRYKIKQYGLPRGVVSPYVRDHREFITFEDHSSEFLSEGEGGGPSAGENCSREHGFSIPLPDPRWLRLHAAITNVMNKTGSRRFLCKLYEKHTCYDDETFPRFWDEFERLIDAIHFVRAFRGKTIPVAPHGLPGIQPR